MRKKTHDRRGRPRFLAWLQAAVALGLALAFFFFMVGEDGADGGLLGSEACIRPRDQVDAYSPFVVDVQLDLMWSIEITVFDTEGALLLSSGRLSRPEWIPLPENIERLNQEAAISWQYDLYDPGGETREFGVCSATLVP